MRELKLPTGGPEEDERDGVVGLFAKVRSFALSCRNLS